MSASVVAKGDSNLANTYWLETAPAQAPAPPVYSYPTYLVAPVPMAGSQWDYGMLWVVGTQWVELWPTYDAVVHDT
eukprot:2137568-Lingulodinium_polyedra.AAC.1